MTPNRAVTTNSSWAALRNPDFRKLWIATVLSGTCVAAHDNAVTWMMNTLTEFVHVDSGIITSLSWILWSTQKPKDAFPTLFYPVTYSSDK
jgi:hypothetical protein